MAHRPLLETCLADVLAADQLQEESGQIQLTQKQVTRLRFLVAEYLNETEAVLLAWLMSIADKEMLEYEFQFLYDEKRGANALEKFRKAMGGKEAFPAIDKFVERIQELKKGGGVSIRSPVA